MKTNHFCKLENLIACVYFIQCNDENGYIKIGWAFGGMRRLRLFQGGCPYELKMIGAIIIEKENYEYPDKCRKTESDLHRRFASAHLRGEWFLPTPELLSYIASLPRTE